MFARAFFGTSSWSEKSWDGVFYPKGMAPGDYLAHYATEFDTVEADVTYYRVPDRKMVEGWNRKTPDGFVLSAKFPRSVVHGGEEAKPDPARVLVPKHVWDDAERFLASMSLLGGKCGPLVLQFPYFNKQVFGSIDPFLERLDAFLERLPKEFRYGVEIRNKAWVAKPLLSLLQKRRAALVLVDLVYMPHPADLAEKLDLVTTDFVYGRLIGDRNAIDALTETFDKVVIDQKPRLERWAALLKTYISRVPIAYMYANNHYAGHAPTTIRELIDLMKA
ncbi:MAG: DUF72 domain-containing protein [Planctomycetes bacterium]|nr:DUF72 domain-containing protein [Planctomycetota bacterium]